MAKRKRLTPAALSADDAPLEAKATLGWIGHGTRRPPIAEVTGEAAQRSALEEVAEELRQARTEGRMVLRLPLSAVEAEHLVRDRVATDPEDMATLTDSLRDRGQQTPVEVVDLGGGRYGLISGWRRLLALKALSVEDGDRFGFVQALVRAPDTAAQVYRAMVEENEIRADLSFYERARITVQTVQQGIYPDPKSAVQSLFSAARPAKRSKILSFAVLVQALDDHLRFPAAIPEKLGLPLAAAVQTRAGFGKKLAQSLHLADPQDAASERLVLEQALKKPVRRVKRPEKEVVAPGLALEAGKGRVVLSGKQVDDDLLLELRLWLKSRNK